MTKRPPENLRGSARYRRRAVRNVRLPEERSERSDDPDHGSVDETSRRPITLPRVQFLERPDPDNVRGFRGGEVSEVGRADPRGRP